MGTHSKLSSVQMNTDYICLESGFIIARLILLMNDGVRVFSRGWIENASPFESTK